MKNKYLLKLIGIFLITLSAFTSCTTDEEKDNEKDNGTNPPIASNDDSVLLTKLEETFPDGETTVTEYTYSGMTLIKVEETETYLNHNNDLVTLTGYSDYIYENDKLIGINSYDTTPVSAENPYPDYPIKETYTYDTQGRIKTITTSGTNQSTSNPDGEAWVVNYTLSYNADSSVITQTYQSSEYTDLYPTIITLNDGNIVSIKQEGEEEEGYETTTYTYGNTPGLFKNIDYRDILISFLSKNNNAGGDTIFSKNLGTFLTSNKNITYTTFGYIKTIIDTSEDGYSATFTYNKE